MLSILVIPIGSILIIAGLIGCILAVLPGPSLSLTGLFILAWSKGFSPPLSLTLLTIITIIVSVTDYIMPPLGANRYGASRWGVWGSIIGMIVGIFFFPPFGIFIGGFLGRCHL